MTSPLAGKRVLVARAKEQAGETSRRLRALGAVPVEAPAIVVEPPEDRAPILEAARSLATSAWDVVAFTSRNAVDALISAAREVEVDLSRTPATFAAIGPSTARALSEHGLHASIVPSVHRGEALAAAIVARGARRVLVPRAAVAREALPDGLRAAGVEVDVVIAYRSTRPDDAQIAALRAALEDVDVVLFTSGSTVDNLCDLVDDAPARLASRVVASIGPITSDACRARGLCVDVESPSASLDALLSAIEAHLQG